MATPSRSNGVDQHGPKPAASLAILASGKFGFELGCKVMNMNRLTVDHSAPDGCSRDRSVTVAELARSGSVRRCAASRRTFAINAPNCRVIALHKAARRSRQPHPAPAEYPSASWR